MEKESKEKNDSKKEIKKSKSWRKTTLLIVIPLFILVLVSIAFVFTIIYKDKNSAESNDEAIASKTESSDKPKKTEEPQKIDGLTHPVEQDSRLFNDSWCTEYNEMDKSDFEVVKDYYVKNLNDWNFSAIEFISNSYVFEGNQVEWNKVRGSVTAEVVKDEKYDKLVKLTMDIKDAGSSALKKGENIRYVHFVTDADDNRTEWKALIMTDENNKDKYYSMYENGKFRVYPRKGIADNGGLGYSDSYEKNTNLVLFGEDFVIDLDGDGKEDTINVPEFVTEDENGNIECNGISEIIINGKSIKCDIGGCNLDSIYYYITDIDKSDKYCEIVFYDDGPSGDPCRMFYRYDGEKIVEYNSIYGFVNLYDCKGDKNVPISVRLPFLQTWFGDEIAIAEDDDFICPKQWVYTYDEFETEKDLDVYSDFDTSSETFCIKKGTTIRLLATDMSEWIWLKTEDGKEAFMHMVEYDLYECNGVTDGTADLYSNWDICD